MKFIIIATASLLLASCGTAWNIRISDDGITATPDGGSVFLPLIEAQK